MTPPIDPDDSQQVFDLYRDVIASLNVDDLERIGSKYEDGFGHRIREMCHNVMAIAEMAGLPSRDYGMLLVVNGLSAIAASIHQERISSQN